MKLPTPVRLAGNLLITLFLLAQATAFAKEGKKWRFNAALGGGYNTNVINLGEGARIPNNIRKQESAFGNVSLAAGYAFKLSDKNVFGLHYRFLHEHYEVNSRLNVMDYNFMADFRRQFSTKFVGGFQLSNQHTLIQTANFRNSTRIRPAVGLKLTDWLASELAYAFSGANYFFPAAVAAQDRDGFTHVLSLTNYFAVPDTKWRATLGYFFLLNNAAGNDFDSVKNGFTTSISHPLFWKVSAAGGYSRTFDRYAKINTLGNVKRSDDVSSFFIRVDTEILKNFSGYLNYNYINNDSNLRVYNYNQHAGSAGFVFNI